MFCISLIDVLVEKAEILTSDMLALNLPYKFRLSPEKHDL